MRATFCLILCLWFDIAQCRTHSDSIRQLARYEFPGAISYTVYPRKTSQNRVRGDLVRRSLGYDPEVNAQRILIDPPDIHHDDIFQLEFRAFNATFRMLLEPNLHLLHPEATLVTSATHQGKMNTERQSVDRSQFKIYKGSVVRLGDFTEDTSLQPSFGSVSHRLFHHYGQHPLRSQPLGFSNPSIPGDARFTIYETDESGKPVLDGSFRLMDETYFIKPIKVYEETKRDDDPTVTSPFLRDPTHRQTKMIIYRSSDYAAHHFPRTRQDASQDLEFLLHKRDLPSAFAPPVKSRCAALNLPPNQDPASAVVARHFDNQRRPEHLSMPAVPWYEPGGHYRRSSPADLLRRDTDMQTCPGNRRIVYFGVAADCTYVNAYQTPDKTRAQILSDWNQASAIYERQFNVMLGVIEIQLQEGGCPTTPDSKVRWNQACSQDYSIESRLSDFSYWRGQKGKDNAGLWHLMTNCASGSEVGIAWLAKLCVTEVTTQNMGGVSTYVTGTAVSAINRDEWQVVAHEIGHNFGASHDCDDKTCPCSEEQGCSCCPCKDQCSCDANYIMNPSNPTKTDTFSPCSVDSMCSTIASMGHCLQEPGNQTVLDSSMCGNGIKEKGEECDCGTPDECEKDSCCDGTTCKLKPDAKCSDKNDLCCQNCQIKVANTLCRTKYSECDTEEVCDGVSADCPSDIRIPDGTACGAEGQNLECASGQCTSRDAQCVARGGSLNIKERCTLNIGADPCDMQCNDPQNSMACIFLSGSFVDGTTCGWHSKCREGKCKGDNGFYDFILLFQRNLAVSIPVTIAIVIVIVGIIGTLCCRCCNRSFLFAKRLGRKSPANSGTASMEPTMQVASAGSGTSRNLPFLPFGNAPNSSQGYTNIPEPAVSPPNNAHFVDPTPYNGPSAVQSGFVEGERGHMSSTGNSFRPHPGAQYPGELAYTLPGENFPMQPMRGSELR
ncbi:hypothetical protein IWQ61_008784 [Dispira simplex]|nr:hypothetical protein IWQ61_008784 [Dispira simplex]